MNQIFCRMSFTCGIRCRVIGSAVSKQAASAGSAEFLAPLAATSPRSGVPPTILNLSIFSGYRNAKGAPKLSPIVLASVAPLAQTHKAWIAVRFQTLRLLYSAEMHLTHVCKPIVTSVR